jgi:DNA-binding IclR family transcriptional regulator
MRRYTTGRTAMLLHILRSRLSRYGPRSARLAMLPSELAMLVGCTRHSMHVCLRDLERQGAVRRIAHGLYAAVSVVPFSVQAEAFPAGSSEA